MPSIKAILLDLDGTLLDTAHDLHAAANGMLLDMGRQPVALEAIRAYVGRGIPALVKRVLADYSPAPGVTDPADDPVPPPPLALASFRQHYARFNGQHARLYAGVMEGIAAFKARGLPLGVVTNKARAFTQPLLESSGLAPYMDVVVSGDSLPRAKPDPMPVVWACGRLGFSPDQVVMIGDSVHDAKAARAAGCFCFLVPYGYNEGHDIHLLDCDAIVSTLADAARRL